MLAILTTSSGPISSSLLSITRPRLEYSRMDWTSRILLVALMIGPSTLKAMIWRLSGLTIGAAIRAMGPLAWTLRMGVPINLELYNNISLL